MDHSQSEYLAPVEGERFQESLGRIWAIVGGCILILLAGGAVVLAWWTQFPLYDTEEVREVKPEDQLRAGKVRMVGGKEVLELPAAPKGRVPVKTHHVLGPTYALFGVLIVAAGLFGIVVGFGRLIQSSRQRPTLIIGQTCFQLVVRDNLVKVHVPYRNISAIELVRNESNGKPMFIGVNLADLNDPATHYRGAARSKKWTGWDYAMGNKEMFAVPIVEIYERLKEAMT